MLLSLRKLVSETQTHMLYNTSIVLAENVVDFYHRFERVFCVDLVNETKLVHAPILLELRFHLKGMLCEMLIISDFQSPKKIDDGVHRVNFVIAEDECNDTVVSDDETIFAERKHDRDFRVEETNFSWIVIVIAHICLVGGTVLENIQDVLKGFIVHRVDAQLVDESFDRGFIFNVDRSLTRLFQSFKRGWEVADFLHDGRNSLHGVSLALILLSLRNDGILRFW